MEGREEGAGRLCPPWPCVHPCSRGLPSNIQRERHMPREAEEGDLWDEASVEGEQLDEPIRGQRGTPEWVVSTELPFAGNQ